ncbi:MAG: aminotransferase class I/II-fold pyridoxal phosphate-dependent enzyme [Firmicutes bacterium]|nr:aminotransferase class I/II-fold pyridoxal phosphate-dependent enzyme [Bacillota bacterium]
MDLFARIAESEILQQVNAEGINPYFHELQSRQDTEVIMEGKRRIMLGSNNYLGLTVHPQVVEAAKNALDQYGTGCSGSRFLNGTLDMHIQLEKELSAFLGKEEACTFSTGFQSNLGAISAVVGRHDYMICDIENHASIYDGCRLSYGKMLRFKHSDMDDLERKLQQVPEECGALIITDGVFSMSGDICKLPDIVELGKRYGARIMVDDAHGLGVLGRNGRGTADHFGLTDQVDLIMSTFSKSLAALGGFISGDARIINYIRYNSRPFIFSASMPPSNTAAALAALRVIEQDGSYTDRLMELAQYMRARLKEKNIAIRESSTPIIPIYTYDELRTLRVNRRLYEEGVYVNCVLPPATAPGECLLRCSLMATHTHELIDEAVEVIARVLEEF